MTPADTAAADPSLLTLPRIVAEAVLTDFVFAQGSDFDAATFPGMDRLRTMVGADVALVVRDSLDAALADLDAKVEETP